MELLILNGANPDVKDIDGRLPLHWSTHPISIKPIDLLLKVLNYMCDQPVHYMHSKPTMPFSVHCDNSLNAHYISD